MNNLNNLYIDLVSEYSIFILFNNDKKNIKKSIVKTNKNMIDIVIDQLNNLLLENNLKITDIKNIYVNKGPGSFTGVRAAINIVKTIYSIYKNINIYTINTLETLHLNNGIGVYDAKGNKLYIEVVDNNELIIETYVETKDNIQTIKNKFNNLNVYSFENISEEQRAINAINNLELFKLEKDVLELEPYYVKNAC